MAQLSLDFTDVVILSTVGLLSAAYYFFFKKDSRVVVSPATSPAANAAKKEITKSSAGKKSLVEKLRSQNNENQLVFFYGSQTGTAEDLATRLGTECTKKYSLPVLVCDPEEYDMMELVEWIENEGTENTLFGFFMATYGEGEPTDNTVDFYEWIMAGSGKGDDEGEEEIDDDELLESESLRGLPYVAFGLGNKTYEHYNAIGKRLDRRLAKLGGVRIGELGLGDDDDSMEEDFLAWKTAVLVDIAKYFGLQVTASGAQRDAPHVPLFDLVNVAEDNALEQIYYGEHSNKKPRRWHMLKNGTLDQEDDPKYVETEKTTYDSKHPHYGRILKSRPLFVDVHDEYGFDSNLLLPKAGHKRYQVSDCKVRIERHCLHVDLDLGDSGLKYVTGDHVGVWPVNDEEHVQRLAQALHISHGVLDSIVQLKPNKKNMSAANAKMPFPAPCTVRTALVNYLDVSSTIKQHQLEILAKYADDPAERTALFELSENRERYVTLIEKSRKDLADILEAFPSIAVPIVVVIGELLPRIAVRYYSISSSSVEEPTKVGITAVMVRYAIPSCHPAHRADDKKNDSVVIREGLATSWLQRLHEQRTESASRTNGAAAAPFSQEDEALPIPRFHLPMYIRTSNFKLPKNPRLPVVMVGPGTGVAPFRAFVRERFHLAKTRPEMQVGPTWLFYGCRHPDKDFLYRDEFEQMEKEVADGSVKLDLRILKAYSRVEGQKKQYVQHMVQQHAEDVWNMIGKQKGSFYVCGDAKHMAHDVHETLTALALDHGNLDTEERAKTWVKDLKSQSRYLEDVWA
ncbi:hypothetical protein DFJ77DRAFT_504649 [Powellomyces hirtus]|nr:hypothetical protein DFJ77DRAFT_504649 [Powellomyces hirtus]